MSRRPAKVCKNCLWWWDLYDTGERKCYRAQGPFYHQLCKDGCEKYEYHVRKRMNMKIGMAYASVK